jgi:hypothetical protein
MDDHFPTCKATWTHRNGMRTSGTFLLNKTNTREVIEHDKGTNIVITPITEEQNMDPNKTLANIRAIITDIDRAATSAQLIDLADELSWMVKDLDGWIIRGGFLPAEWDNARTQAQRISRSANTA